MRPRGCQAVPQVLREASRGRSTGMTSKEDHRPSCQLRWCIEFGLSIFMLSLSQTWSDLRSLDGLRDVHE
eukprot:5485112-Pyramimonas_sp.AAC.1